MGLVDLLAPRRAAVGLVGLAGIVATLALANSAKNRAVNFAHARLTAGDQRYFEPTTSKKELGLAIIAPAYAGEQPLRWQGPRGAQFFDYLRSQYQRNQKNLGDSQPIILEGKQIRSTVEPHQLFPIQHIDRVELYRRRVEVYFHGNVDSKLPLFSGMYDWKGSDHLTFQVYDGGARMEITGGNLRLEAGIVGRAAGVATRAPASLPFSGFSYDGSTMRIFSIDSSHPDQVRVISVDAEEEGNLRVVAPEYRSESNPLGGIQVDAEGYRNNGALNEEQMQEERAFLQRLQPSP